MSDIRNTLLAASILLVLGGCARREDESAEASAAASGEAAASAPAAASVAQAPKMVAPIQVEIALSPAAQTELTSRNEGIVVEAVYGGDPTAESSGQANEFGLIELGKTEQQLPPAGGVANFDESAINRDRLSLVIGQPQVMINVRSARKAAPNNLLACDLYWDSVKAASSAPVRIPCSLLSEGSGH